MDGRKKAADMYTALAYTHKSLNRHLVYRAGHVSVATQQHIADIQAEKALAALSLKVEGTPPPPPPRTQDGTLLEGRRVHGVSPQARTQIQAGASKGGHPPHGYLLQAWVGGRRSPPRSWEFLLRTPPKQRHTQERLTKKPRISPLPKSKVSHSVSDTTVSSLSHVEQLCITQLEGQMLHMHRTLDTLFPELPHFTATGLTPDSVSSPPAEMPRKKPPPSPAPSTSPDKDVEMSPTDAPNTNPAKQAEVEEIE